MRELTKEQIEQVAGAGAPSPYGSSSYGDPMYGKHQHKKHDYDHHKPVHDPYAAKHDGYALTPVYI